MIDPMSVDQVAALAAKLPPVERLRLVEKIVHELAASSITGDSGRRLWSEIRGIVAYPMLGEDAQASVSRTRREADEHREKQWRQSSGAVSKTSRVTLRSASATFMSFITSSVIRSTNRWLMTSSSASVETWTKTKICSSKAVAIR